MSPVSKAHLFIGKTFARLTIVSLAHKNSHGERFVLCRCTCGTEKIISLSEVKRGSTVSCGCYRLEVGQKNRTKHGLDGLKSTAIWRQMHKRCYREDHWAYRWYGARGIYVDERWHTLSNFIADMGEKPEGLSLDRIDNNGPYGPGNCRWASRTDQSRNTRSNRKIEINGETRILTDWVRITGVAYSTFYYRVRSGMSPADALLGVRK